MTEELRQETATPAPPQPKVSPVAEKTVLSEKGASVCVVEYKVSTDAHKALNVGSAQNLK